MNCTNVHQRVLAQIEQLMSTCCGSFFEIYVNLLLPCVFVVKSNINMNSITIVVRGLTASEGAQKFEK